MIKSKKKKPLKQKISSKGSHALSIASTVPSATFMEHVIKTYLAPFPCSPPRPIPLSVQRQELHQHMYVIDKFLLLDECAMWIEHAEAVGFVEVFQAATSEYAHRDNGRLQYDDADVAEAIFQRLMCLLPPSVDGLSPYGCSANIRLYRYKPGQRFGRHIDESNATPEGGISKFTLLIYLNGEEEEQEQGVHTNHSFTDHSKSFADKKRKNIDCRKEVSSSSSSSNSSSSSSSNSCTGNSSTSNSGNESDVVEDDTRLRGGETFFYPNMYGHNPLVTVHPVAGRLLLHGHGQRCLTHEGAEVLSGVKYLLRTDVMYR